MSNVLEVTCPRCGAGPGIRCETKLGNRTDTHAGRIEAAHLAEAAPPPLNVERARLPKKLKYRVRAHGWVWCDFHCGVHDASLDVYDESAEGCNPDNWRRIYIETDDKAETF